MPVRGSSSAQHDSRDPVEMSLDELREGLLVIQRAEQVITVMAELVQMLTRQSEAEERT